MKITNVTVALFLIFFSLNTNIILANNGIKADSIFFHIYNQQYQTAEDELNKSGKELNSVTRCLLETDLKWWQALTANNSLDFAVFEKYLNDNLKEQKNLSGKPDIEEFIYLNYSLRLMAVTKQHLKLVNCFMQINRIVETFDENGLTAEGKSIFMIYKAVFKISKNKFLLFNTKNNSAEIENLKQQLSSQNIVNKTFAHYFLAKIYTEIEKNPGESRHHYSELCKLYPKNQFFKTGLFAHSKQ